MFLIYKKECVSVFTHLTHFTHYTVFSFYTFKFPINNSFIETNKRHFPLLFVSTKMEGQTFKFRDLSPPLFFRIHFSYTDTADTEKMALYLGKRWEMNETAFKRSYMSECRLCDEYLYLPIKNNGTTFEHQIFRGYADYKMRFATGRFVFAFSVNKIYTIT